MNDHSENLQRVWHADLQAWSEQLDVDLHQPAFLEQLAHFLNQFDPEHLCPQPTDIFRAFRLTNPKTCLAILIGEDPYPRRESACGIAFYDAAIRHWQDRRRNNCMFNMLKALAIHTGQATYGTPLDQVRQIACDWPDPPTLFEDWAGQGLLLLNATLTFSAKKSPIKLQHFRFWQMWMDRFLVHCNQKLKPTFILWGQKAINRLTTALGPGMAHAQVIRQGHPTYQHQFLKPSNLHFSPFNELAQALPIRWMTRT
ncbi:MAG: hypothetical protein H6510_10800 [Acidobacteria bacterium]|nr:hypothetical protein [Acidobacteriota bacterium]MCB9398298.1 hypothetical protein [Acidobacteriota bacterium]